MIGMFAPCSRDAGDDTENDQGDQGARHFVGMIDEPRESDGGGGARPGHDDFSIHMLDFRFGIGPCQTVRF